MGATLPSTSARLAAGDDPRAEIRTLLAALVVILMPFPVVLTTLSVHKGGYDFQAIVFPSDIALLILLVFAAPDVVRSRRTLGPVLATTAALWVLLTIAWVVHPSDRGLLNVLRFAGLVALAWSAREAWQRERRAVVLGALAFTALSQCVLALVQLVTRDDVGLGALGEFPQPFYTFGERTLAPQGTMVHIYLLAGLALVAATILGGQWLRAPSQTGWLVAAAIAAVPIGITYSRAAALGLVVGAGALVAGGAIERAWRPLILAVAVCATAAIAAAVWSTGWSARITDTAGGGGRTTVASATTGRNILMHQAWDLIKDKPLIGVGTGRYVMELRDRGVDTSRTGGIWKPVHNVPLLLAAEAGVGAGLLVVALLVLLAWRALIAGPAALAVYLSYLPYVLLDHFPYTFPQGQITTGIWIGAIELFHHDRVLRRAPAAPGGGP